MMFLVSGEMKQNQDRSVCASEAGAGVDHAAEILIGKYPQGYKHWN